MKNGEMVAEFEREFAAYVGAKYAIALCNGTATLHTALAALGIGPGQRVAVPPLTMSSTALAVVHARATPVWVDIDPDTWLMTAVPKTAHAAIPVSLYGLYPPPDLGWYVGVVVNDAAQTLKVHSRYDQFTSYSFQASKILPLGEGGMLVTNNEALAASARSFASLGYEMRADQPRIDPATLKSPNYVRHPRLGWNYRMSDLVAEAGLRLLERVAELVLWRASSSMCYEQAHAGCSWVTGQRIPEHWLHDYWCYAVATDTPQQRTAVANAMERHGGERPYAAWRLGYDEPAFHALPKRTWDNVPICPVAEKLQPRLLQFQTNKLDCARRNADALGAAIREVNG